MPKKAEVNQKEAQEAELVASLLDTDDSDLSKLLQTKEMASAFKKDIQEQDMNKMLDKMMTIISMKAMAKMASGEEGGNQTLPLIVQMMQQNQQQQMQMMQMMMQQQQQATQMMLQMMDKERRHEMKTMKELEQKKNSQEAQKLQAIMNYLSHLESRLESALRKPQQDTLTGVLQEISRYRKLESQLRSLFATKKEVISDGGQVNTWNVIKELIDRIDPLVDKVMTIKGMKRPTAPPRKRITRESNLAEQPPVPELPTIKDTPENLGVVKVPDIEVQTVEDTNTFNEPVEEVNTEPMQEPSIEVPDVPVQTVSEEPKQEEQQPIDVDNLSDEFLEEQLRNHMGDEYEKLPEEQKKEAISDLREMIKNPEKEEEIRAKYEDEDISIEESDEEGDDVDVTVRRGDKD